MHIHFQSYNFDHEYLLDPYSHFQVQWTTVGERLIFRISALTQGWIGLGFSPNGGMQDADIAIVWVERNGRPHLSGRLGPRNGNGYPSINPHQHYSLLNAQRNATHLSATISRNFDTCDPQGVSITTDTMHLIWAYSNDLPENAESISKHTARGSRSVHMLAPQSEPQLQHLLNDPSIGHYDVKADNVAIPSDEDTFYYCQLIELPKRKPEYLVGYGVIIDPNNLPYVHHALVYSCSGNNLTEYLGKRDFCFSKENVAMINQCQGIEAVWAVGGEPFVYPSNMARSFFEPDKRFFMLEMHYNNPNLVQGIVDNSVFRFYLQQQPRPITVGTLEIVTSTTPLFQVIPPKTPAFTTYVYCPSQCTRYLHQPLNIFSGFLHSHLLGRQLRLRHIRNGIELPPIVEDMHYDFNYQDEEILSRPVVLMPGDDLILECTYDSTSRDNVTTGGISTHEEMCMAFLQYFPKQPDISDSREISSAGLVQICISITSPNDMLRMLGATNSSLLNAEHLRAGQTPFMLDANGRNVSVIDFYNTQVNWNDKMVDKLQDFARNSEQTVLCMVTNGSLQTLQQTNSTDDLMKIENGIAIKKVYEKPSRC